MTYAIKAPARYAQGAGELANLGRSAKKLGNKFLVICTDNSRGRFGAQVEASLAEQEKEVVFTTFHGEATKDEVFAKMDECRAQGCDVVVGMGGGKALDTAKAVAENLGLPCVIIPTVASNDAPCSGVAVLYNDAGVVIKAVLMRRNPDLVLVDTGIIANAPRRLFAAGLGDALSTWFEARACKNSGARTMARGNVSNTGLMMARLCYDLLMEKGRDALAAVERHEVTPALEDVVEATIYLSGLGALRTADWPPPTPSTTALPRSPRPTACTTARRWPSAPWFSWYWRRPPRRSWSRCSRSCGTPACP